MSWQITIPIMVRHLIGDVDEANYKYSDSRIEKTITICAQLVNVDTTFNNNYIIDISGESITPDPTQSDPIDYIFINLVALRCACFILGSEVKTESANAISIKDGPSAIDLRGVSSTLNALYQDYCKRYKDLLDDYKEDRVSAAGQAILGPYSPGADFISRTHNDYDFRGNYFRY